MRISENMDLSNMLKRNLKSGCVCALSNAKARIDFSVLVYHLCIVECTWFFFPFNMSVVPLTRGIGNLYENCVLLIHILVLFCLR